MEYDILTEVGKSILLEWELLQKKRLKMERELH